MMGNLIQQQFFQARDWPFGATLALSVLAITHGAAPRAGAGPEPGEEADGRWRVASGGRATGSWRACRAFVYGFLYVPILVLVVLSFNETGRPSRWGGFSTQWYGELLRSPELIDSFKNTLVVAVWR